jgi:hypothetical protein
VGKKSDEIAITDMEEEQHREFLLAKLRAASLRAKVIDAELTSIGVALKGGMIGADTAVAWIRDEGLLWFIGAIPERVGRVANANISHQQDRTEDESCEP